ncbi:ATP-binding cassette domain-containing protein [Lactobacillus gasseri]|uniref:ATP-binding cassette domain-containing protein n=1 Tax=Lactobacillus gasseri TaxID=1596 RepID=UPI0034A10148
MLELKNIKLSFGNQIVLNDLNYNFQSGKIYGLVAPNGTGKSTLINVILNNLKPQSGYIKYDNLRYTNEKTIVSLHKKICAFPDQSDLFSYMTERDHLKLYANLWQNNPQSIENIITKLKMENYVNRKVETYSLGMKQRLCFAMVVSANTPVMLLDEVMNGLDQQNIQLVSQVLLDLRTQNKLIIMASHLLQNLQQYADQVLFLKDGKIIEDFNNKTATKQYLEFKSSALVTDVLNDIKVQTLPNKTSLVAVDDLDQETFNQITNYFLKNNISFTVTRISLENLFNKFYG